MRIDVFFTSCRLILWYSFVRIAPGVFVLSRNRVLDHPLWIYPLWNALNTFHGTVSRSIIVERLVCYRLSLVICELRCDTVTLLNGSITTSFTGSSFKSSCLCDTHLLFGFLAFIPFALIFGSFGVYNSTIVDGRPDMSRWWGRLFLVFFLCKTERTS